jgi:fatty acid-binding protein DegV
MKNLANNGRINPAVAAISGALGIRVVGKASDQGTLQPLHKCRGEGSTLRAIVKEMLQNGWNGGKVCISHCLNCEAANLLAGLLRKEQPNCSIDILPCTALCSFYAEKGGMIIGYEGA